LDLIEEKWVFEADGEHVTIYQRIVTDYYIDGIADDVYRREILETVDSRVLDVKQFPIDEADYQSVYREMLSCFQGN
jgi:hypothetical protein